MSTLIVFFVPGKRQNAWDPRHASKRFPDSAADSKYESIRGHFYEGICSKMFPSAISDLYRERQPNSEKLRYRASSDFSISCRWALLSFPSKILRIPLSHTGSIVQSHLLLDVSADPALEGSQEMLASGVNFFSWLSSDKSQETMLKKAEVTPASITTLLTDTKIKVWVHFGILQDQKKPLLTAVPKETPHLTIPLWHQETIGAGMCLGSVASVIQFGKTVKRIPESTQLGQYKHRFKMRFNDFTLFTKKENTMTSLFPSQLFHEEEDIDEVSPIAYLENPKEEFAIKAKFIFKYSVFYTEEEVMTQFTRLPENSTRESRSSRATSGMAVLQGWLTGRKDSCYRALLIIFNLKLMDVTEHNLQSKKCPDGQDLYRGHRARLGTPELLLPEKLTSRKGSRMLSGEPSKNPRNCFVLGDNVEYPDLDGAFIFSNCSHIIKKDSPKLDGSMSIHTISRFLLMPRRIGHLLQAMEEHLAHYGKDIAIAQNGVIRFWDEFGYLSAKWNSLHLRAVDTLTTIQLSFVSAVDDPLLPAEFSMKVALVPGFAQGTTILSRTSKQKTLLGTLKRTQRQGKKQKQLVEEIHQQQEIDQECSEKISSYISSHDNQPF
ncbi:hypothetical protein A6R68_23469 [Neotoma lepida]|uniref:Uncharacterized protein n=1 Tax=Neotoma lepida TaxID=56216 RepID=A0A1A6HWC7_NEOLE|nr:hypothetical protein A6R68_23469 [Neotoma lepida]